MAVMVGDIEFTKVFIWSNSSIALEIGSLHISITADTTAMEPTRFIIPLIAAFLRLCLNIFKSEHKTKRDKIIEKNYKENLDQ